MKISTIIPTIGRKTLPKVVSAIIHCRRFEELQSEIIVVFDGKKTTPFLKQEEEILKQVQNERLLFIETKTKSYSGGARNLGLEKATGDIIAFLGDDTIPTAQWLEKIESFHTRYPDEKDALLGKISWTPELASKPFYQWLEDYAQFAFKSIAKHGVDWRHFYTSNVSVKKSLIETDRFSSEFQGWGFEDIEFGYRLAKKGMQLHFDHTCEVLHDHQQTLENFLEKTRNMRKNAHIFESMHPEIHILPRGFKLITLQFLIWSASILSPFSQKLRWMVAWKKAWIGIDKTRDQF